MVEKIVLQRRSGKVDASTYEDLHRDLLRTCRSLAETAGEEDRGRYERLAELVEPWLNTASLESADRPILFELWRRCLKIQLELRTWKSIAINLGYLWFKIILALLVLAGAVKLLSVILAPKADYLLGLWNSLWSSVTHMDDIQKLGLVTLVVVLISLRVISQTPRT